MRTASSCGQDWGLRLCLNIFGDISTERGVRVFVSFGHGTSGWSGAQSHAASVPGFFRGRAVPLALASLCGFSGRSLYIADPNHDCLDDSNNEALEYHSICVRACSCKMVPLSLATS